MMEQVASSEASSLPTVAVFTDTYLPTVNGVSYTIHTWRERWRRRGGRMDVVFPDAEGYDPGPAEHPVRSVEFPFYDGFRVGLPAVPDAIDGADVVHAHTPFLVGFCGRRYAKQVTAPLLATYHTPTPQYADYVTDGPLSPVIERAARGYERWFFDRVDGVTVPSETARDYLLEMGVTAPIHVVSNGVDTENFRPVGPERVEAFRTRHGLPDGPLVGYTGRHGYEKNLEDVVDVATELDATVVLSGDGPAREDLADRARQRGSDVYFLGFLDRSALPAFYSSLEAFLFPSPVETQGLVALEAIACGTPVVGADSGALRETIDHDETGYHYESGDVDALRAATERARRNYDRLRAACLQRRSNLGVDLVIDRLVEIYDRVG